MDLSGPGFARRCYGFWDGGSTFRVRLLATCPGQWSWRSGSQPEDAGLAGRSGAFEAVPWTDAQKQAEHDSIKADAEGNLALPPFPGTPGKSDTDWAVKLSL